MYIGCARLIVSQVLPVCVMRGATIGGHTLFDIKVWPSPRVPGEEPSTESSYSITSIRKNLVFTNTDEYVFR